MTTVAIVILILTWFGVRNVTFSGRPLVSILSNASKIIWKVIKTDY